MVFLKIKRMINTESKIVDGPWGREECVRSFGCIIILYFLVWVVVTWIFHITVLLMVNRYAIHICVGYTL